jgi:hypothetical protein
MISITAGPEDLTEQYSIWLNESKLENTGRNPELNEGDGPTRLGLGKDLDFVGSIV